MELQSSIPIWLLLLIGLTIPISTIIGIIVAAKIGLRASDDSHMVAKEARSASRDATLAANDAAKLVETVAVELKAVGLATATKLATIEAQGEKIHGLVNNQMSEALKKNAILADLLLATDPDNPRFQQFAKEANQAVADHAPADSNKDDEEE
jgi:hypothetical protein